MQISLPIQAVWSVFADNVPFTASGAIERGIYENSYHTGWMYRLIWVFAGHTGVIYPGVKPPAGARRIYLRLFL